MVLHHHWLNIRFIRRMMRAKNHTVEATPIRANRVNESDTNPLKESYHQAFVSRTITKIIIIHHLIIRMICIIVLNGFLFGACVCESAYSESFSLSLSQYEVSFTQPRKAHNLFVICTVFAVRCFFSNCIWICNEIKSKRVGWTRISGHIGLMNMNQHVLIFILSLLFDFGMTWNLHLNGIKFLQVCTKA